MSTTLLHSRRSRPRGHDRRGHPAFVEEHVEASESPDGFVEKRRAVRAGDVGRHHKVCGLRRLRGGLFSASRRRPASATTYPSWPYRPRRPTNTTAGSRDDRERDPDGGRGAPCRDSLLTDRVPIVIPRIFYGERSGFRFSSAVRTELVTVNRSSTLASTRLR